MSVNLPVLARKHECPEFGGVRDEIFDLCRIRVEFAPSLPELHPDEPVE